MQEVSKEAVGNCLRNENASVRDENVLTLAHMDLGGRRRGGCYYIIIRLRKMPHLGHVVGFACCEVLVPGHEANGCELFYKTVSTKQAPPQGKSELLGFMSYNQP